MTENNNRLAQFVAQAVNEYLQLMKTMQITNKHVYKFSTKIWFDIENNKVNSVSIADPILKPLNNSLNKKYRIKTG